MIVPRFPTHELNAPTGTPVHTDNGFTSPAMLSPDPSKRTFHLLTDNSPQKRISVENKMSPFIESIQDPDIELRSHEASSSGHTRVVSQTGSMEGLFAVPQSADGMDHPMYVNCSHCNKTVLTKIRTKITRQTILTGCLMALFSLQEQKFLNKRGICCLCLVPCVVDDYKDVYHHCSTCKQQLGSKKYILFE